MSVLVQTMPVQKAGASDIAHVSLAMRDATDISAQVIQIIFEYALNKFDDTVEKLAPGIPGFIAVVMQFVMAEKQIEMCLPAFPFKSANKVYKALGTLPDKAEELALDRLNSMCKRIREIYEPGAKLLIISDGLVYNGMYMSMTAMFWGFSSPSF